MNTLILIILGSIVGLVVSRPRYSKGIDVIMGSMGTLATSAIIGTMGLLYNAFSFLFIMIGSVIVIYIGRSLENLPHS